MENWKIISECPVYSVSDLGHIRNDRTGRILKATPGDHGVLLVHLSLDGKPKTRAVHVLVAKAFVINPKPNEYVEVDHKDLNRANCAAFNLQWTTHPDNVANYWRAISKIRPRTTVKLTSEFVNKVLDLHHSGLTVDQIVSNLKERL